MKKELFRECDFVNQSLGFTCSYTHSVGHKFLLHYHDYYEVFIMMSGTAIHDINGEDKLLNENSLILIRPNDTHTYKSYQDGKFSFINLAFKKEIFENLFLYLGDCISKEDLISSKMPPTIILSKRDKENLLSRFGRLNILDWENHREQIINMKLLLVDIFAKYFTSKNIEVSSIPPNLEKLVKKMNNKEYFYVGIDKMVELSGYSREHLSRLMRKHYNTSITEFINNLRINYACNMLINSNIDILSICYDAGFLNLSWFYKVFKKNIGITPSEFREKYTTI